MRQGHAGQSAASGAADDGGAVADDGAADARDDDAERWDDEERLLVAGAIVVDELRAQVSAELGFTCSGGVARNKMLAKLGCGLHKPDQQTIVLPAAATALPSLPGVFAEVPSTLPPASVASGRSSNRPMALRCLHGFAGAPTAARAPRGAAEQWRTAAREEEGGERRLNCGASAPAAMRSVLVITAL